jgi:hypothetical protein
VGFGNGTDDREAESVPGTLAHAFGADLLERLEQSVNVRHCALWDSIGIGIIEV